MANNVHGLTVKDENGKTKAHPLYWVWHEKKKKYDMCEDWADDVMAFHDWCIENGWEKGKQVRRHNTKEAFSPENCYIYTVRQRETS
jgi:hypothetical protein